MSMSTLGQGPSPRKNPSSVMGRKSPSLAMGRILLGMDIAEGKGGNIWLVATLHIVPQGRKSTKAEKDNGENGSDCHYCIQCLVPNTAILLCPYNHSQQLEGRADGTSTYPRDPIQEKENNYKKGVKKNRKGERPPNTPKAPKKLLRYCQGPILSSKLGPWGIPWWSLSIH